MTIDVAIIGAGPAGGAAALVLAAQGVSAVLIDENAAAGGQVWRGRYDGRDDAREGTSLRERLSIANVATRFGARVWHIEREANGFTVAFVQQGQARQLTCRALILATGARERVVPCPGWALPGVIGLAGATALLKGQGVVPGERTLVAGSGPLLYALAASLIERGVRIPAIVDLAGRREWLGAVPALMARPGLLATGARWMARIRIAGVPVLYRHAVRMITGADRVTSARIGPVDGRHAPMQGTERSFDVDAVCIGHGLMPSIEAAVLLGAATQFDAVDGTWALVADENGATTVPGLFVAGDGIGIEGAAAASISGQIAALSAARMLTPGSTVLSHRLRRERKSAARFGRATSALAAPRDGAYAALAPETILCRCECVTTAMIDRAIDDGATTIGSLKGATRACMGPCGGKICADSVAARLAFKRGCSVEAVGLGVVRSPLRPIPLAALATGFDYAEMPPLTASPL